MPGLLQESKKTVKHIVSFSGGKDSTALILKMIELKMPIDEIIFYDTGWEWPQIVDHVAKFEKYIGRPIVTLKPKKSFEWHMFKRPCALGKGKGFPRFNLRWCTGLKQMEMKEYLKKQDPYLLYLGITADEVATRIRKPKPKNRYLLIELGLTEADCLKICKDHGFDFGGLYDHMSSTSCWCCPLQPLGALKNLYVNHPDLWKKLLCMQARTKTGFKFKGGGKIKGNEIYVTDYDERFKKEGLVPI